MTKTSASAPTASHSDYDANPSGIVVGLTVSMSWQLALAVLIPVVGGHLLDDYLHPHATPIYTLIGLLLAIIGMISVVRRTLKELNKYMQQSSGDAKK
jgi:F0F1-type ATP synthase assembly protein I